MEGIPHNIAVLIPCYNEESTIGSVIYHFQRVLPSAQIYVYDNNSTDDTAVVARTHGALVRSEPRQGKGNVIRRMFADIEADIYIIVDGDDTYDAESAPALLARLITEQLDFVNGARQASTKAAFRKGHKFGNRMLSVIVQLISRRVSRL